MWWDMLKVGGSILGLCFMAFWGLVILAAGID